MADTLLATQLRKGMIIKLDNELFRIHDRQHVTPGNLRGFVRLKMRNLRSQAMSEHKARSEDVIERATLDEKEMQFLYSDGDGYHFMDTESYEQFNLSRESVSDVINFMQPSSNVQVLTVDGKPSGVSLPASVELEVVETEPGIKGDTVSNVTKPAKLETGATVQVPLFVNTGDRIKVAPAEGRYISRA